MGQRPYTPERAYRVSVLPLGVFFIVGGAFSLVASFVLPIVWLPFVHDERMARFLFAGVSLLLGGIGVGLVLKSKAAWYALFAWWVLGTVWPVAGWLFDPPARIWAEMSDAARWFYPVFGLVLNGIFVVGLYVATRPAFLRPRSGTK